MDGCDVVDQRVWAIHSANGPTACLHILDVSESWQANSLVSRQFSSRCSKNHFRCNGARRNQSSTNESTCGRIGSIRSHAKLSRVRVSVWRNPRPGSSPSSESAPQICVSEIDRQLVPRCPKPPGAILVFDRGYTDYEWFANLSQQAVYFVTRLKENADYGVLEKREVPQRRGVLRMRCG